jgi:hypothetical protein
LAIILDPLAIVLAYLIPRDEIQKVFLSSAMSITLDDDASSLLSVPS